MNWMEKQEEKLLQKSFLFGIFGIMAALVPLFNRYERFTEHDSLYLLNGIGIGLQLFALSIAVLVLRKPKISHETKSRAQRMAIALSFSLIFFFVI